MRTWKQLSVAAVVLAVFSPAPAYAQVGGVTAVGVAPGMAVGSRTITANATVAAIDMTTRVVTLRRADGTTFSVVAGPDVRNLPQLRVGDSVTLDYVDVLTVELKKGGTGAPASIVARTDATRTELGQRPGGAVVKETKIVADVIAVDSANQRVTLRGPQGNQVVLPVRDRAQFNLIRVGDQIEADYVEAVALSVTPVAQVVAAPPRWIVGLRAIGVYPNDDSSIPGVSVDSAWTAELDFTYFLTPNVAVELIAATAKHQVNLNGTEIGKVGVVPPTLTLQYHFTQFGAWKPYVGAGVNYTYFYDRDLANDTLELGSSSWGGALQTGVDYMFDRNWSVNFDLKYIWMDTDVEVKATGANAGDVDINPWIVGVGVRYRF
jgi:outer membrane protein